MGSDMAVYRAYVLDPPLDKFSTNPAFHIVVHWQALKEAVRQDCLAALAHPGQIRDAASAKMFSMLCM
jgi:hypothetical protein